MQGYCVHPAVADPSARGNSWRNLLNRPDSETPLTVAEYVRNTVRSQILRGDHQLGEKLDQQALAEALGVSIIPLREGLRQLEIEGFVHILPRRGAFVTDLSIHELQEIYLIREELEALATREAVPNLSIQDLDALAETIRQMADATEAQDYARLYDLNRAFHFTIYSASGKPLLLTMLQQLWSRSALYRRLYTYLPERTSQALAEHRAIYAACREGDVETAAETVRHNVRQTVEGIVQRLNTENQDLANAPSRSTPEDYRP